MKHNSQLVFWEMALLLASVLVFRALWLLLDHVDWMSRPAGLWGSLAIGLSGAMIALAYLNRASKA